MNMEATTQIQICFLERMNEHLRQHVAMQETSRKPQKLHWPMFFVSGFISLYAWTLSWMS